MNRYLVDDRSRKRRWWNRRSYWALFALLAVLLHVLGLRLGGYAWSRYARALPPATPKSLVILEPPPRREKKPEEEQKDDTPDGQIVETAKPKIDKRPDDAKFLAQYDNVVPKETRSERFKVNPKVVSPKFSEESKAEQKEREDLHVNKDSTGATAGGHQFDPARDGVMAAVPSKWKVTNEQGLADPVLASRLKAALSGAPQNDLLDVQIGDSTQLSTKEVLFAAYLLRIRRLVNFYWEQNLDNLPSSTRVARPEYTTGVMVTLNGDGAVERIDVTQKSGLPVLDDCVTQAYRIAGPFPNPPEQLIAKDGRAYLPLMTWTVQFRAAQNQFQGVDPRAGVQFPGLLKSPR